MEVTLGKTLHNITERSQLEGTHRSGSNSYQKTLCKPYRNRYSSFVGGEIADDF